MFTDNTFIFNGVPLDDIFLAEHVSRPVGAHKRFTQYPIIQGSTVNSSGFEAETIKVTGTLLGETPQEVLQARVKLTQVLTEPAGEVRITFPDDLGMLTYSGFYVGGCEVTGNIVNPELTLAFFIPRMIAYGATHELAINDGDKHEVVVGGTQPTYPRFSIDASKASGTVGIVITKYGADDVPDKLVKISASAGVVIVDMERERAYTQGASAARIDLSSDFFALTDGDKVRITCNASGWSARMSWEERYV